MILSRRLIGGGGGANPPDVTHLMSGYTLNVNSWGWDWNVNVPRPGLLVVIHTTMRSGNDSYDLKLNGTTMSYVNVGYTDLLDPGGPMMYAGWADVSAGAHVVQTYHYLAKLGVNQIRAFLLENYSDPAPYNWGWGAGKQTSGNPIAATVNLNAASVMLCGFHSQYASDIPDTELDNITKVVASDGNLYEDGGYSTFDTPPGNVTVTIPVLKQYDTAGLGLIAWR